MCNRLCHALPLFVSLSLFLFVFQAYHLIPFFFLFISQSSFCLLLPLPALHRVQHPPPFLQPLVPAVSPLLLHAPAVATAAEVPLSRCAAGPTMKMCNVWHSWNESPNRRGSGYHRAPPGPASVCLTLIMAHANECAALKSGGACLPDSVCRGVVCHSVCMWLYVCVCVSVHGLCCSKCGYVSLFGYLKVCVCVRARARVCAQQEWTTRPIPFYVFTLAMV